jgi:Zn2+/Cd2+-exporting ATPase
LHRRAPVTFSQDAGRGWRFVVPAIPRDQRSTELAFTIATVTLLMLSVEAERLGVPAWMHRSIDGASYITGGWFALLAALPKLAHGTLDVDFLMLLAAGGAASTNHWHEGGVLLFLFSLSNTLQAYAMDRSRRAIDHLLKRRPRTGVVLREREEITVPIEELRIRDIMLVRPGEMISTDGVIRRGQSEMDESSITGESRPVEKAPGDLTYAGALNGTGAVEIEVTRLAEDSTLARIVKMVESAEQHKARAQRFLERVEGAYAWTIVGLVALLIIVPWSMFGQDLAASFYRAMVVLVVASPCALVISTPAAILAAVANGARHGILFKGGAYLENMAEVRVVVFDKTGTLTTGKPGVSDVVLARMAPPGFSDADLLAIAAALESRSEHPLAREIVLAAAARGIAMPAMDDFVALPGRGVHAHIGSYLVWIGSDRLYREHGEQIPADLLAAKTRLEAEGKSALILHREVERREGIGVHEESGGWLGLIAMSDTIRPQTSTTVTALRRLGIERTVMLTGDNAHVARAVAEQAGIDEFHASLLPEDKVRIVAELKERYGAVMMIGDGINDAPALANASVGVAMGAAGSDLALETAHCVLMSDDLEKVAYAVALSRRTLRTVIVNLSFSAAVIVALLAATFAANIPLPLGILGHEGSTVIVCLNGLRLLGSRRP